MRVYNRKDFIAMPEGTVFCKGTKWNFGNLCIKGYSFQNDFLYVNFCDIDSEDSEQRIEFLEDSLKNGTTYEMSNQAERDGCFNEDDLFLVFRNHDLEFLAKVIKPSKHVTPLPSAETDLKEKS